MNIRFLSLAFLAALMFSSCLKDDCKVTRTFVEQTPIWIGASSLNNDIAVQAPRALKEPGKIYFYNNLLLINDKYEGVHIIDNTDKSNPISKAFIEIPGNIDIAIRGNYLFADNYTTILVIDISDFDNPVVVSTLEGLKENIYYDEQLDRYLVGYRSTDNTMTLTCDDSRVNQNIFWIGDRFFMNGEIALDAANGAPINQAGTGIAGSLARFALINDYFYYINDYQMKVLDIEEPTKPNLIGDINLGWGIETIFPYGNNLFIGSQTGMHIFDNSNPANPTYLTTFEHAQACDPVVVEGTTAYVTLRDGSTCQNFNNQLDVIDISNLLNPKLIKTYPMYNPHGLAIRNSRLFICEAEEGLKIYDATDTNNIDSNLKSQVKDIDAYDIIALNEDCVMVIGKDGLFQYDTSNPSSPKLLSKISTE